MKEVSTLYWNQTFQLLVLLVQNTDRWKKHADFCCMQVLTAMKIPSRSNKSFQVQFFWPLLCSRQAIPCAHNNRGFCLLAGKAEQVRDKATPFRSEPDGGAGAHQPQPSSSGSIPSAANICPHMENITCSNVYIAQHISIPLSQPLQVPSSVYYPQNYQPGPSAPSYVPEIPSHPPAELFSESNWKDSVPIARSETPSRGMFGLR